ncbi:MAG: helix-turn-helix domain-containing protein [Rhodospirillaceae bacterium]|nr:helix-turn-helix domain-containing protein [Rhodospirillaceae bacterium]
MPAATIDREFLRSTQKCFEALELINLVGSLTAAEAVRLLEVPRTTAVRVLQTLVRLGYVVRNDNKKFTLTPEVNRLSFGYRQTNPDLPRLQRVLLNEARDYLWPLELDLPHATAMYTYIPTDELTPYKLVRTPAGTHIPYMGTAAGTVYLAHCTQAERAAILRVAREDPLSQEITLEEVREDIKIAQAKGYFVKNVWRIGTRQKRKIYKSQSVIAVPILSDGKVRGCLSSRVMTAAVTKGEITRNLYPRLRQIADLLGEEWRAAVTERQLSIAAE